MEKFSTKRIQFYFEYHFNAREFPIQITIHHLVAGFKQQGAVSDCWSLVRPSKILQQPLMGINIGG